MSITKISCRIVPTSSGYRPVHIANTTPDTNLITVAATRAIEQTTMVDTTVMTDDPTAMTDDPTAMIDDPTVTTVGRIGTIGIETGLIEMIGDTTTITNTIGMRGDTATTTNTIGTTILTIATGADLGTVPDATVAGILTTWKIGRAGFL